MKFLEVFDPIVKGDFGLTDEMIYKSIQHGDEFIPVWGGGKSHSKISKMASTHAKTKKAAPMTIFNGCGIIISLDGSAGSMTYKPDSQKFALNHHAGFFRVKRGSKKTIDPNFFVIFCAEQLKELSVSEGSRTLSPSQIYEENFDIPPYDTQIKIMDAVKPVLDLRQKIKNITGEMHKNQQMYLFHEYSKFQVKEYPINRILDCVRGNGGLTEAEIYKQIQNDDERYTVLSSSTETSTKLGQIPLCYINGKKIRVFENKEGILVIRNGKAGTTFLLKKGRYTINDHAYILSLKSGIGFNVLLKWLMYHLRQDFLQYSSSSDNGTWNKTGFFKHVTVDIPILSEQQKVMNRYQRMMDLNANLESMLTKINELLKRIVVL